MPAEARIAEKGGGAQLRFGDFMLDESRRQLFRGGEPLHISPKAFHLLTLLIHERPRALSKADLHDKLWPGMFVSDGSLTTVVGELRSALGDDRSSSRFIRTLHGFGYAFTAIVSEDAPGTAITPKPEVRVRSLNRRAVVCVLTVALLSTTSSPGVRSSADAAARREFVEGKQLIDRAPDEAEALSSALVAFKKAAAHSPNYGDAYAGIAHCYAEMGFMSMLAPADAFPASRDAALTALRLDPNLADAYVSLGDVESLYEWNKEKAGEHYQQALSLNPSDDRAHLRYGFFLAVNGRFDESLRHARRARELNPSGHAAKSLVGWVLYLARRYDEAIREYKSALETEPDNEVIREDLANAYLAAGRPAEAFAVYQQWARVAGYPPEDIEALDDAWRTGGMNGYWRQRIEMEKQEASETGDVFPYRLALLYARIGDTDHAFDWLERAYEQRSDHLVRLATEPAFDAIRHDARFERLSRRVGSK